MLNYAENKKPEINIPYFVCYKHRQLGELEDYCYKLF